MKRTCQPKIAGIGPKQAHQDPKERQTNERIDPDPTIT